MGFFDSVSSAVNRGTTSVQRTGRSAQLKMQLNDLVRQRRDYAARLGASLYETVKDMPEMREGREPLFEGIAQIDEQLSEIEAELAEIEAAIAQAQRVAHAGTRSCSRCGAALNDNDLFCSGCGLPVPEPSQAPHSAGVDTAASAHACGAQSTRTCATCGAPVGEGDAFCMSCGAKVSPSEPALASGSQGGNKASEPAGVEGTRFAVVRDEREAARGDSRVRFGEGGKPSASVA